MSTGQCAGKLRAAVTNTATIEPLENRRLLAAQTLASFDVKYVADNFRAVGPLLYFDLIGTTGGSNRESYIASTWRSDGTSAGTRECSAMENDRTSAELVPGSGKVVFVDNFSLYYGDRKTGSTLKLKTFPAPTGYETGKKAPYNLVAMNGVVYFGAGDGVSGTELWRSDGTVAGTRVVKDIQPVQYRPGDNLTIEDSDPKQLTVAGGHLYFSATTFDQGTELWTSDGTANGTHIVANLATGGTDSYGYNVSSTPTLLATNGGKLFFSALGTRHSGLFTVDPADNDNLAYLSPALAFPQKAVVAGSHVFFITMNSDLDGYVWSSDGTSAGTVHVLGANDMHTGPVIGGTEYFTAWDKSIQKYRLWRTDGTAAGTQRTAGLVNYPAYIAASGGKVYFVDTDGVTLNSYRPSSGAISAATTEVSGGDVGAASGELFFAANHGGTLMVLNPSIGAIGGTIYNDADSDGVRDSGEAGISGYRVFIDRNTDGICNKTEIQTRTNSAGRYRFESLLAGSYRIRVTPVSGRRFTTNETFKVAVTGGATTTRNFGATANVLIAGAVFLDADSDGVRDSLEQGLAGWRVFIDADGDGLPGTDEMSTLTNESGRYAFGTLKAGTYVVRVEQRSGYNRTIPSAGRRTITLAAGQISAKVNFGQKLIG